MRYYYLYLLHLSTLYYQATIVTLGAPACKIIEEDLDVSGSKYSAFTGIEDLKEV